MADRSLRVLHLLTSARVGGGEGLVLNLAAHTDHSQVAAHVGLLREVPDGERSLLQEFAALSVPLVRFRSGGLYSPTTLRAVIGYLRRERIDLIHTHLLVADVVGRIAGALAGVPVISTLQNEPRSFAHLRADRRLAEQLTARWLRPRLAVVSEAVREQFVREWHLDPQQMAVVYNGVAMEHFLALEPRPNQAAPKIVTIGRLHIQKSHEILLRAARLVLAKRPEVRFQIVGQGEREAELRSLAVELGVADQVEFAGVRRDIDRVLNEADIFTLTSQWEGLPLTAVEAMAAARAVVLSDVGGCRELINDPSHGRLVPSGDPAAMAAAYLELLADPALRIAMGHAARARVREAFNIATIARQYAAIYHEMLAERSAQRLPGGAQ